MDLPGVVKRKAAILRGVDACAAVAACEAVGKHGGNRDLVAFRLRELETVYSARGTMKFDDLGGVPVHEVHTGE